MNFVYVERLLNNIERDANATHTGENGDMLFFDYVSLSRVCAVVMLATLSLFYINIDTLLWFSQYVCCSVSTARHFSFSFFYHRMANMDFSHLLPLVLSHRLKKGWLKSEAEAAMSKLQQWIN